MVPTCPACGSDRVILLTFPQDEYMGDEFFERPLAKCVVCRHQLTADEVAAQEQPH
jgi:hypothetical protein